MREREDCREGYGWGHAGTLPLYQLEMASAKDLVSCKLMFVLRKHVFLVVSPCGWVMASRHFEGTYHLHVQVYESVKFNNNNNNNNNNLSSVLTELESTYRITPGSWYLTEGFCHERGGRLSSPQRSLQYRQRFRWVSETTGY